jgi:hypothetical protein
MHQEDRIEKFTFEKATFNIPQKVKEVILKSKEIQFTLKNGWWCIGNL